MSSPGVTTLIWLISILGFILVMVIALIFCKACHDGEEFDEEIHREWEKHK